LGLLFLGPFENGSFEFGFFCVWVFCIHSISNNAKSNSHVYINKCEERFFLFHHIDIAFPPLTLHFQAIENSYFYENSKFIILKCLEKREKAFIFSEKFAMGGPHFGRKKSIILEIFPCPFRIDQTPERENFVF